MIAILLDQGLAPGAAVVLRKRGFDAIYVLEIGLDKAEDLQILMEARLQNRVCVTLDHDFHTHLAIAGEATLQSFCSGSRDWPQLSRLT